jgi:hypothetical protein
MALYTVSTGITIAAADINQLVNVLQEPSGGLEKGRYRLAGGVYATNAVLSHWVNTLSRNSVPVSLTIDTADATPNTLNAPAAPLGNSNAGGFLIYATATAAGTNAFAAGNWQANY